MYDDDSDDYDDFDYLHDYMYMMMLMIRRAKCQCWTRSYSAENSNMPASEIPLLLLTMQINFQMALMKIRTVYMEIPLKCQI